MMERIDNVFWFTGLVVYCFGGAAATVCLLWLLTDKLIDRMKWQVLFVTWVLDRRKTPAEPTNFCKCDSSVGCHQTRRFSGDHICDECELPLTPTPTEPPMPSNQCDKCGRSQYPGETDTCKRCLMERIIELQAQNDLLRARLRDARPADK